MDIYDGRPVITVEDNAEFLQTVLLKSLGYVASNAITVESPADWRNVVETSHDQLAAAFRKGKGGSVDQYAVVTLGMGIEDLEEVLIHHSKFVTDGSAEITWLHDLCLSLDQLRMRLL